jgi:heme-degrading monooxygenase HmoA
MMHVRYSLITADERVLAECLGFLASEARPVLEIQRGSLGLALLAGEEPGVAIVESFWATHDAFWLSAETDDLVRGELARRVGRPVTALDFQVPVFEREAPLRGGEAVRLTRVEVKPLGVPDVIEVYGDTAVPRLAGTPGFRGALLLADPASGQLISQTVWRDPPARAAGPSVASVLRREVLAEQDCEIRGVEDYRLAFSSARKPTVPSDQ